MLEELQRRNYSGITTRNYLLVVADFAKYFGKSPDKLGLNELRTYQAYLLRERKLTPGTVVNQVINWRHCASFSSRRSSVISNVRRNNVPDALIRRDTSSRLNTVGSRRRSCG